MPISTWGEPHFNLKADWCLMALKTATSGQELEFVFIFFTPRFDNSGNLSPYFQFYTFLTPGCLTSTTSPLCDVVFLSLSVTLSHTSVHSQYNSKCWLFPNLAIQSISRSDKDQFLTELALFLSFLKCWWRLSQSYLMLNIQTGKTQHTPPLSPNFPPSALR